MSVMVYSGSVLGLHSPSKANDAFEDDAKDSISMSVSSSAMAPMTFALIRRSDEVDRVGSLQSGWQLLP
jgi:hypothetical protein